MTDLKCFRLLALLDNHFFLLSPLSGFPISHYSVSTIFHYFMLQRNQMNWICKIIKFIMPKENRKRRGDFPLLMIMLVVANKCPPTSMNHGGCLNCLFNYNRPWWACGQMLLQLDLYFSISYFLSTCVCVLTIANVYNSFCKYNGHWTKIQNSLKFQRRERTQKMD